MQTDIFLSAGPTPLELQNWNDILFLSAQVTEVVLEGSTFPLLVNS
jgi:hypothetical protein